MPACRAPVEIYLTVADLDEVLAALCKGVELGEDAGDIQHPALLGELAVDAGRLLKVGGGGEIRSDAGRLSRAR